MDEAHSLGVLGERGRGLVEEEGVLADADFIVGTFSKSLGGAGGFCVSDLPVLDLVRYSSRPYIFTASPSPATIASTRAALVKLAAGRELRAAPCARITSACMPDWPAWVTRWGPLPVP